MNLKMLLIAIALLNFFLPLGFVPLFDLDEGAFSEATREMLTNSNYLTTYLNGHLRFDKPILIYWLQALSVKTFGLNEFALRLPSAIAATLWATTIWHFGKRLFNQKVAFYATLTMLGALQINIIAKAAIADALLNLFITLSLFLVLEYLQSKKRLWLYLAYGAIALGFLTKGPVAILVPLATLFLYLAIKGEYRTFFKTIFNPIGLLIFTAIAMPWYILEYLDQGQKFIDGFFLKHNLERFNTSLEHHSGAFFYYIPVLLIGFLPFTTPLLKALKSAKKLFKIPTTRYLLLWFGFVFIFFSLSGTKLPHYIIYGYTPLFLLIGQVVAKENFNYNWTLLLPPILLLIALLAFPYTLDSISVKNSYIQALLDGAKVEFSSTFSLISLALIALLIALKFIPLAKEIKFTLLGLLFGSYINFVVLKNYAAIAQQPIKEAALLAKQKEFHVQLYHFFKPSFLVYRQELSPDTKPKSDDYLLTKKSALKSLKNYKVIYSKYGVYLLQLQ